MDDKEIKRTLKDVKLYLTDTEKALKTYPGVAKTRFEAAMNLMDKVEPFIVNRPMGEDND